MSTSISHIITPETEFSFSKVPGDPHERFTHMISIHHSIGNTAYIFFEGDQFEKFKDAINEA